MSTQELTSTNNVQALSVTSKRGQYNILQILGVWAGAALPMGLIYWVVMPTLRPHLTVEPGFVFFVLTTLGMVWQGTLAYVLLRREVRPFTWEGVKSRLWLFTPSNPRTGLRSKSLFWWMIPLVTLTQAYYRTGVMDWSYELLVKTFPVLTPPTYTQMRSLAGPAVG